MARKYYTVCTYEDGRWFDEFGSFKLAEVKEEEEALKDQAEAYGRKRNTVRIVSHDGTAQGMMAARDALPAPK